MTEKTLNRKQAIREYKERVVPRGIFAIKCTPTGRAWVDSSPNLGVARNRIWFGLRLGNHPNRALQEEWNQQGEDAFTYEVLETLEPETPALNLADTLKVKKRDWVARLNAAPLY